MAEIIQFATIDAILAEAAKVKGYLPWLPKPIGPPATAQAGIGVLMDFPVNPGGAIEQAMYALHSIRLNGATMMEHLGQLFDRAYNEGRGAGAERLHGLEGLTRLLTVISVPGDPYRPESFREKPLWHEYRSVVSSFVGTEIGMVDIMRALRTAGHLRIPDIDFTAALETAKAMEPIVEAKYGKPEFRQPTA